MRHAVPRTQFIAMEFLLRDLRATTRTSRLALTTPRTFSTTSIIMASRISDTIKKDHRDIESYYDRIIGTSDQTEQTKYQNQFTWELARHSIGEELVVYPAFEKFVPTGVQLANKDRQEHQTVSIFQGKFIRMRI